MGDKIWENRHLVIMKTGSGMSISWDPVTLTSCVSLGKLLNFSDSQFPHLQSGDNASTILVMFF